MSPPSYGFIDYVVSPRAVPIDNYCGARVWRLWTCVFHGLSRPLAWNDFRSTNLPCLRAISEEASSRSGDRFPLCWAPLASSALLFAHATFDATAQRSSVDCQVGANDRGINETDWLDLTTLAIRGNGHAPVPSFSSCLADVRDAALRVRVENVSVYAFVRAPAGPATGDAPDVPDVKAAAETLRSADAVVVQLSSRRGSRSRQPGWPGRARHSRRRRSAGRRDPDGAAGSRRRPAGRQLRVGAPRRRGRRGCRRAPAGGRELVEAGLRVVVLAAANAGTSSSGAPTTAGSRTNSFRSPRRPWSTPPGPATRSSPPSRRRCCVVTPPTAARLGVMAAGDTVTHRADADAPRPPRPPRRQLPRIPARLTRPTTRAASTSPPASTTRSCAACRAASTRRSSTTRLLWPDTMSVATDRYLYVTANQLYRQAKYCDGEDPGASRTPCSGSGSTQARSCSGGERTVSRR